MTETQTPQADPEVTVTIGPRTAKIHAAIRAGAKSVPAATATVWTMAGTEQVMDIWEGTDAEALIQAIIRGKAAVADPNSRITGVLVVWH